MSYITTRKRTYSRTTLAEVSTNNKRRLPENVLIKEEDADTVQTVLNDSNINFLSGATSLRYFYLGLVGGSYTSHGKCSFHALCLPFLHGFLERCQADDIKLVCDSDRRWVLEDAAMDDMLALLVPEKLGDLFKGTKRELLLAFFFGWLASGKMESGMILFQSPDDHGLRAAQAQLTLFGFVGIKLRLNTTAATAIQNPCPQYQLEIPIEPNTQWIQQGLALLEMERIPLDANASQLKTGNLLDPPLSHWYDENTFLDGQPMVARDFFDQPLTSVNAMLQMAGMSPLASTRDLNLAKFIATVKTKTRSRGSTEKIKLLNEYLQCTDDSDKENAKELEGRKMFSCRLCDKTFRHNAGLFLHTKIVHGPQKIPCTFDGCDQTFLRKPDMDHHLRAVHEHKNFACPMENCDKVFAYQCSLNLHIKANHKNIKVPCPFRGCSKIFNQKVHMDSHFRNVHENKKVACSYSDCQSQFATKKGMKTHVESVHERLMHACTFEGCDAEYRMKRDLVDHIQIVHHNQKFTCTFQGCDQAFNQKRQLTYHFKAAHQEPEFPCPFDDCQEKFSWSYPLEEHIRVVHEKKKFTCPIEGCLKTYSLKGAMVKHLHTNHDNEKFPCDVCKKEFASRDYVLKHIRTVHKPQEKSACTFEGCDRVFWHKSSLHYHIRSVHKNIKVACTADGCEAKFTTRHQMMNHVHVVHENQKFDCTFKGCNRSFSHKKTMETHVSIVHENQKIACKFDGCEETFQTKSTMVCHFKVVHENNWAVCPFDGCDKRFANPSSLKPHIKIIHLKQPKTTCTFDGCTSAFAYKYDMLKHLKKAHGRR